MAGRNTSHHKIQNAKTDNEHVDEVAEISERLRFFSGIDSGPVGKLAADILHAPLARLACDIPDMRLWEEHLLSDFRKAVSYVMCLANLKHSAASNRRANALRQACSKADSTNASYVSQLVLHKKALDTAKRENKSSMKKLAEPYVEHSPEVLAVRQVFLSTTDDFLKLRLALQETNRRIQPEKKASSSDSNSSSVEQSKLQHRSSEHTTSQNQIARRMMMLASLAGTEQSPNFSDVNRPAFKKESMYVTSNTQTRSE
jgi:hypothetical protein